MPTKLEKIYNSGLSFLTPLTLEETYQLVIKEAMKLVKAEYGSIFLEEDGELKRVYASNPELYKVVPRKNGFTYTVFKEQKPAIFTSEQLDMAHKEFKKIGMRSDIMIPLANRGQAMGVLTIMSLMDQYFNEEDLNTLKLLGPLASLAIRKAQLYNELASALELRDLFISMAAHELRTPLTSINGYAQLLFSRLDGEKTVKVESRWIEQLMYESIRLTNLVKELLSINQIKTGELQYVFKEVDINEIINRSINNCKFIFSDREFTVQKEISGNVSLIGDFDKLVQALTNIIENAAKFSDPETKILVKLCYKKPHVIIQITDSGIGISKTDFNKIFEIYYRGKDHTREGMGIGMYLTKEIIEKHHGSIKIISKKGKGTCVEIHLPKVKI
jgi:signal transduction histidine kinase